MTSPEATIAASAQSVEALVSEAGAILLQANTKAAEGSFGAKQWAKSANKLLNIALTAAVEFTPPLLSGPCLSQLFDDADFSDFIETTPDNAFKRVLSVCASFTHTGAPGCAFPDQFIVFSPPILPVYAKLFRVGVAWPDARSGTYRGRVRLTQIGDGAQGVDEMDVIVDL
jgi:hypothetical protein